jgi:hypothetical protein
MSAELALIYARRPQFVSEDEADSSAAARRDVRARIAEIKASNVEMREGAAVIMHYSRSTRAEKEETAVILINMSRSDETVPGPSCSTSTDPRPAEAKRKRKATWADESHGVVPSTLESDERSAPLPNKKPRVYGAIAGSSGASSAAQVQRCDSVESESGHLHRSACVQPAVKKPASTLQERDRQRRTKEMQAYEAKHGLVYHYDRIDYELGIETICSIRMGKRSWEEINDLRKMTLVQYLEERKAMRATPRKYEEEKKRMMNRKKK